MSKSEDRFSDAPSTADIRRQIGELKVAVNAISQKSSNAYWNAIDRKITFLNLSSEDKQNLLERQLRNDTLSYRIQSLLDRLED